MTREELNTQIDADITNKTTAASITPTVDGANRKKIVDYVDEQIESISLITGPQGIQGPTGPQGPQGPSSTSATSETITSSQGSAPFTNINKTITLINSSVFPYGLAMPTSLGEVRYVRSLGAATLYSVPNPGNEEFNINFITPEGNGNSIITLQASKVYRFTYLGDFGGELGFWTAEIINNIY